MNIWIKILVITFLAMCLLCLSVCAISATGDFSGELINTCRF